MTPHNRAQKDDIAKIVIMPGDPMRAKYITENYLDNYRLVNDVRGMLAYTGTYKGKEITVMASGMGIPSMGIYSYELFKFYDVDVIIRIGTMGAYSPNLNLFDVVLNTEAYSDSTYALIQSGYNKNVITPSIELNNKIKSTAERMGINVTEGRIYSSEVFYKENENYQEMYDNYGCLGVEMESFSLFHNANVLGKKAACILTVSDSFVLKKETTSEEREKSLKQMIELCLETIVNI